MERVKFIIILFFVSSKVFSYDFTYLESKIPPESFEMCIYNFIKTVIANSEPKRDSNLTTFIWNNEEVRLYEDAMTKTRYPDRDTIIIYINKTFGIEIIINFNEKHDFYEFRIYQTSKKGD
jgi:hypothetical protein